MMVRQMKEDAKGKSEEELAECFRIFDRCVGGGGGRRLLGSWPWEQMEPAGLKQRSRLAGVRLTVCPAPSLLPKGTQTATSMPRSWLRFSGLLGSM